jgi:hypothetical protein
MSPWKQLAESVTGYPRLFQDNIYYLMTAIGREASYFSILMLCLPSR